MQRYKLVLIGSFGERRTTVLRSLSLAAVCDHAARMSGEGWVAYRVRRVG